MSEVKISFSINGDPTRGYKNVASVGFVKYTSQTYLRPNTDLTEGGDTYVCYITDKAYELHLVTHPSKVGGWESRGAFNVGIAVPKGYRVYSRTGERISISQLVRSFREEFARIAMTSNEEGMYLYDQPSLSPALLNEKLQAWLDKEYRLVPESRKEIVMKGKPEIEGRAILHLNTRDKVDEFFDDPNFSELKDYGSVEVICSNQPSSLKLDIPRKKQYDLILIYKRDSIEVGRTSFHGFFKNETEQYTLPIGRDMPIQEYEEYDPEAGLKKSLAKLKQSGSGRVKVDDVDEKVTMTIDIKQKKYDIEIKWVIRDDDRAGQQSLSLKELRFLCQNISFTSGPQIKEINLGENGKPCYLQLRGAQYYEDWQPKMKKNDQWKLSEFLKKDRTMTLTVQKLKREITLPIKFYDSGVELSPLISKKLLSTLEIKRVFSSKIDVEKPKISVNDGSITFNDSNKKFEWDFKASSAEYEVDTQLKIGEYEIEKGVLILKAEEKRSDDSGYPSNDIDYSNGYNQGKLRGKDNEYTVVLEVHSRKKLPQVSSASLQIKDSNESANIPLKFKEEVKGVYKYVGKKALSPDFREADAILINDKMAKNFKSYRDKHDTNARVEHIIVKLGGGSKILRAGLPILVLLLVGFLMGSLTQRFCNRPFPMTINGNMEHELDSLRQRMEDLESENIRLKDEAERIAAQSKPEVRDPEPTPVDAPANTAGNKQEKPKVDPTQVRNDILAQLKRIDTSRKSKDIAKDARDIIRPYMSNPNLDEKAKKWFKENILDNNDASAAGTVRKIATGTNYFKD